MKFMTNKNAKFCVDFYFKLQTSEFKIVPRSRFMIILELLVDVASFYVEIYEENVNETKCIFN